MMELARREPIVDNGLVGQASYRLSPAPVKTGSPSCFFSQQPEVGIELVDGDELTSFFPYCPADAGELVGESDGGFVVAAGLFEVQRPGA